MYYLCKKHINCDYIKLNVGFDACTIPVKIFLYLKTRQRCILELLFAERCSLLELSY